jgi:membrane-associated phospholipid phosphatase
VKIYSAKKVKRAICIITLILPLLGHAQTIDSVARHRPYRVIRALAPPAALALAGISFQGQDNKVKDLFVGNPVREPRPLWSMHVADVTQYVPIALSLGLTISGANGRHPLLQSMWLLVQSEAIVIVSVTSMKRIFDETRPDGGIHSFPSGHTAQAFAAATFLHQEYGHKSIWYSVAAYSMATTVGTLRMVSNRHWMSDVLVGASLGILSTNLVYLLHRHKNKNFSVTPSAGRNYTGLHFSLKL